MVLSDLCAAEADQRIVVLSAVEERDLRSRNSDACVVRLWRWGTAVMCMWRMIYGGRSIARTAKTFARAVVVRGSGRRRPSEGRGGGRVERRMLIFVIGGVLLEEGKSRWRRWYQRIILWEDCGIEEDGWAVCERAGTWKSGPIEWGV